VHESERFERFEVQRQQRRLLVDGEAVAIGARAYDVLLALIDRSGQLVTKQELLDAVWSGLVVEENNLVVQVGTLRKMLGADTIATIPGRGYRLTARARADAGSTGVPRVVEEPSTPVHPALTPLIGRDDELVTLRALVTDHPVVSVVGAGGIGKTQLVRHLLRDWRGTGEFVDLSGLRPGDAAELPRTIARSLRIQLGPSDAAIALAGALAGRELLIALDNAEHVIDGVARLAEMLTEASPAVRLVITSQVLLGSRLERVFRLGCLALPDGPMNAAMALGHGSVAFFADRVAAADRRFTVTDENVDLVIEICQRLDGLPLAIELAASRVPTLGLHGVSAALEHRFRLLSNPRRLAPARQKTLRAALDWSHDLLAPQEQAVLRRLGAFTGSFALASAQRVAADENLDDWAVLDAMTALVDRSLVVTSHDDPPRYRLLDSARAYAREKLDASGEAQVVARRHALALCERFVQADEAWRKGRVSVDAFRADAELDLVDGKAAIFWATRHEPSAAVALAPCLDWAMVNEPAGPDRRAIWESTAPLVDETLPKALRARWWAGWHSWATLFGGHAPEEQRQRAVDEVRRLGDDEALYWMLNAQHWWLTLAAEGGQNVAQRSHELLRELRDLVREDWSAALRYRLQRSESQHCLIVGELAASVEWLQRATVLAREAGDSRGLYSAMVAAVDNELTLTRYDDAARRGSEVVELLRASRFESTLTHARANVALAHVWRRDFVAARAVNEDAWPLVLRFDLVGLVSHNLALLAALEGRHADAARLVGYGDHRSRVLGEDRQANESRAVHEAEGVATSALGLSEVGRLKAEGALMTAADVKQVALGSAAPAA
jgi:predicted ATPase/DNA-binding winged helix-turn-helix (wHTH) protein